MSDNERGIVANKTIQIEEQCIMYRLVWKTIAEEILTKLLHKEYTLKK
jgi:hypothetical protein